MLTDTKVRALKPRQKLYRTADSKGLCVEVPPTGARLWRFRYRYNGQARMIGLGEWPAVSLAEARQRRDEARRQLAAGKNPSEQRKAKRTAAGLTFARLVEEWKGKRDVAPVTAKKDAWLLGMAVDAFGSRPADTITRADVMDLLSSLGERELLETARRLRSKISAVFRYGQRYPSITADPAAGLARGELKTPKVRHHSATTDPRRVGELLRAIDAYGGGMVSRGALKLAPLVFARPGELRQAEWSEMDLADSMWRIPAAKMKMRAEHMVPLSKQAVVILRDLHQLTGRGRYVFPSERNAKRPMSENTLNVALRSMGYGGDVQTAHGFRTTASTLLHELGYPSDVIERQLAHKERNAIKDAYNRAQHLPQRKEMMQAWADYLDDLRHGGKILPIMRKAS